MSIKIYWGSLLRAIRVERHLTQDEVANILHIKRQVYSYIECGKTHPTAEELAILSNVYDLDLYRYALKCMPIDYVAEQIEFRTYINSTELQSERKKLRKEKKMKEALEAMESTETLEDSENTKASKTTENPGSPKCSNNLETPDVKTRQKSISVVNSDIYGSISALEAENRLFDSIINADRSKNNEKNQTAGNNNNNNNNNINNNHNNHKNNNHHQNNNEIDQNKD